MKMLLAVDGSPSSSWACDTVRHMSGLTDVTVYLVHVTVPIPEPELPFPDVFMESDLLARERIEAEHEAGATERLEACQAVLPTAWSVVPRHRVGNPAHEILTAIEETGAELAVLGAQGMDRARGGLGGVAQKVSRYAPCHVLIAREQGPLLRHALVALDDGPEGREVLEFVVAQPWLKAATLTLTHVVADRYLQESRIAASQFAGSEAYLARLQSALVGQGQAFLDHEAAFARERGAHVDTLLLEGDPAQVLEDRARTGGFDLLVMGAKGRHGLARFIMGSTSQRVLPHAATSTLLVRTGRR